MSQLKPLFVLGMTAALVVAVIVTRRLARSAEPRTLALAAAAMGSGLGFVSFLLCDPPELFADFNKAYYPGAAYVLRGADDDFVELIRTRYFVNLPAVALLFVPLAALGKLPGGLVLLAIGVAGTVLTWRWLAEAGGLGGEAKAVLFVLIAGNGPLIYSLREGNTTHLILLCLVGALFLLRKRRDLATGLLLGFIAVIKPPLLLFGVYFAVRGRFRVALGGSIAVLCAGLLSWLVFGWELQVIWYESCIRPVLAHSIQAFNSQSPSAFFSRLTSADVQLLDWRTVPRAPIADIATRITNALLVLTAVAAAMLPRFKPSSKARPVPQRVLNEIEFSMVLMLAFLTTGLAWTHYYLLLLMPVAFMLAEPSQWPVDKTTKVLMWAAVFLSAPPVKVLSFQVHALQELYERVGVSHVLAGGFLMFVALLRVRATAVLADVTVPGASVTKGAPAAP